MSERTVAGAERRLERQRRIHSTLLDAWTNLRPEARDRRHPLRGALDYSAARLRSDELALAEAVAAEAGAAEMSAESASWLTTLARDVLAHARRR